MADLHFGLRLDKAIKKTNSILCVGIDPHPDLMPACFGGPAQTPGSPSALENLRAFCMTALQAASTRVPAIKPQAALFEAHGPAGMAVLSDIAKQAQSAGLLVIMDAKRGDIGSTARAYAAAWLGKEAAFPSDALTINPYLGMDSLEPFFEQATKTQSGLFVLVRTSNKGSADIQQRMLAQEEGEKIPAYIHVAKCLAPYIEAATDPQSGLSSIGIVVGATGPQEALKLRALLPSTPFLVPGYGAQGASAAQACKGLIRGPDKAVTGGLVNASRAITHSASVQEATSRQQAEQAMREAIDGANHALLSALD